MKPNRWPFDYLHNPRPDKTVEEMWEILDGYTFEEQFEKPEHHDSIDFIIPLPPLMYEGKVTKGVFYSQAVDAVVERFPRIKEIFIPVANSMFTSYPASEHADALFVCYKNEARMKWYKEKYPERKDKILIPLQDADFLNEYMMAPTFNTPKTVDIFSCMTPYPFKNLPLFASALKVYEKKFCRRLKVKVAIGLPDCKKNPDGSLDYSALRGDAKEQLQKIDEILGDTKSYIDFVPFINHVELAHEYTSAKCSVLSSILEGKNRFIQEAMCCNTPVIVFSDLNKFARGNHPAFLGYSGEYAPFYSDVALADTIHRVLNNLDKYKPRRNYLKYYGRKNFLTTLIDYLPYYRENLPEYQEGKIMENLWVDLAMQDNYQLSLYDFLYGKNPAIQSFRGLEEIGKILKFYYSRFGVPWEDIENTENKNEKESEGK